MQPKFFERLSLASAMGVLFLSACTPSVKSPFEKPIRCSSNLPTHQNWVEFSADNENERYACLGYFQAKYRSWQMDFLRRKFRGTTAEQLGTQGIRADFQMRLLDLTTHADRIAGEISPQTRAKLEAFSYGVSVGFSKFAKDSYEFKKLSTSPGNWTVADTIGVLLLQAFDQTRKGLSQDLKENALEPKWLPITAKALPFDTSILKSGEYTRSNVLRRHVTLPTGTSPAGSNSWVISSRRSNTGNSLLANDPHLALVTPSFWLPFYFRSEKLGNLFGATLPGTPVFASGVNSSLSWGLTNSYFDVMDAVSVQKKNITLSNHRPVIWFRFGFLRLPYFFKSIDRIQTGEPVIPMETGNSETLYVIRWTGFEVTGKDIDALVGIESSSSVLEFDERLSHVGLPSWNFVSADTTKRIGFRTNGKLPRRATQATFGVEEENNEKRFYLSEREAPSLISPPRGFIVTANNSQWPGDAKFSAGRAHALSTRAFRIEEMISEKKKWNLKDLKNIQCDTQAVDARYILDALLDRLTVEKKSWSEEEKAVKLTLEKWDFETRANCTACAVYRTWVESLLSQTAHETSILMKTALYFPQLLQVKKDFEESVKKVISITKSPLPPWNTFHFAQFPHFSGEASMNPQGLLPTEGDNHSVNVGSSDWKGTHWEQNYGASLRMLVEMSSPPRVMFKLAGTVVDIERPEIGKKDSPWKLWSECHYEVVPWKDSSQLSWREEEWI